MLVTQDEQLDRLERCLQRLVSRPIQKRPRRKSRIAPGLSEAYLIALRDYDTAKDALAAKPDDAELIETVRIAGELLDRLREELRH